MNLSTYILAGFSILPKISVVVNGITMDVVLNQSSHIDNKTNGGFEPDNSCIISVESSLLTTPKSLKGKIVVFDDLSTWRIVSVQYGHIVTHLSLISDDKL
jgi:hypothetical protein